MSSALSSRARPATRPGPARYRSVAGRGQICRSESGAWLTRLTPERAAPGESTPTTGESEHPRHKPRRTRSSAAAGSALPEKTRLRHELKSASARCSPQGPRRSTCLLSDPRAPDVSTVGGRPEGSDVRGRLVCESRGGEESSVGSWESDEFGLTETVSGEALNSAGSEGSRIEDDTFDSAVMTSGRARTHTRQSSVIAEDSGVTRLSVSLPRAGRPGRRRLARRHTTQLAPTHRPAPGQRRSRAAGGSRVSPNCTPTDSVGDSGW